MAQRKRRWRRDELILTLELYQQKQEKWQQSKHSRIQELRGKLSDNPQTCHSLSYGGFSFLPGNSQIAAVKEYLDKLVPDVTSSDVKRLRSQYEIALKLDDFLRHEFGFESIKPRRPSQLDKQVWDEFASDIPKLSAAADAIRSRLGAVIQPSDNYVDDNEEAPEGKPLLKQHYLRERNPNLAKEKKTQALKKFGVLCCEACGFSFPEVYGDLGNGFIECHHTLPLSKSGSEQVTHLKDLALVCANCHRMLHRGGEVLTIAELQERIKQAAFPRSSREAISLYSSALAKNWLRPEEDEAWQHL